MQNSMNLKWKFRTGTARFILFCANRGILSDIFPLLTYEAQEECMGMNSTSESYSSVENSPNFFCNLKYWKPKSQ